eukprot:280698_1
MGNTDSAQQRISRVITARRKLEEDKKTQSERCLGEFIQFCVWHILCGGPIIVITRILLALLACLWCSADYSGEHLKIAKFAFNPIGKKLILTSKKHHPPKRPELFNCIAALFWLPLLIALALVQLALNIATHFLTCGHMSKYWTYIWQVHEMKNWIALVDDNYIEPKPVSKAAYNPKIKCKIALLGHHKKYLCAENSNKMICNRTQALNWEHFQSIPISNNKIALQTYHGKYISAQTNGTLEGNRDQLKNWEQFIVEKNGNKFGFKSYHKKWLSAQPDGRIEINRDGFAAWEQFEILVIDFIDNSVKCMQGHTLKFTTHDGLIQTSNGYKTAYICNICRKRFEKQAAFHCKICKYDLCNDCYGVKCLVNLGKTETVRVDMTPGGVTSEIYDGPEEELPVYNDDIVPTAPDYNNVMVVVGSTENPGDVPPAYEGIGEGDVHVGVGNEYVNNEENEVGKWLIFVGDVFYSDYYKLFVDNGFDTMDVVKTLTDYDLESVIGISKVGHRRKLMLEIQKL